MPTALRLGLFYSAIFIGGGVVGPYMSPWLKAHGLSGGQIGVILAAPGLARVVTGPMLAVWADGFRLRRTPLAILGLAVAALYVAFLFSHGFWWWAALWFVSQSLFGSLSPLTDVITLRRGAEEGFTYGQARSLGSFSFIVGNVGMGLLLTIAQPDALLVWMIAAAVAVAVCGRFVLPAEPVHDSGERLDRAARWRGLGGLARDPVFMLAVVSIGLIQASHAFYYGFSTLSWRAQGIPNSVVGLLWGVGVVAELVFLWFMEPLRRALGPQKLVIAGGLGAVTRWTCLALSPPLWLLFPLQVLHALTFTATFMGSLALSRGLSAAAGVRTPPRKALIELCD
jgi:PPP family 3-phenylpropionic acid transporter